MKFSVGLPTGMEGMMYPVPFATPEQVVEIAKRAEALGYDSVWGNDHMTTQAYVRREFATPPNFWEILITYAFVAAATTRLGVGTGVLVLPMRRDIVVLAKQIATLDQFSGGRVSLGVGIGAYREEFEALHPGWKAHRGDMVAEGIAALRRLFVERAASFEGTYYRYRDIEMFPKPRQTHVPVFVGGNSPHGIERAARLADGWLPACLGVDALAAGARRLKELANEAGRDAAALEVAPQFVVRIGKTREQAIRDFEASQMFKHLTSLRASTLKGHGARSHVDTNIIGSVEDCIAKSRAYKDAGATHLLGLYFVAGSVAELIEQAQIFAEDVVPHVG